MTTDSPTNIPATLGLTYTVEPDGSKTLNIPDDLKAWVISFVRENATKTPVEIEAIVQAGYDNLEQALAGVSEAQAAFKPGPGDWSILELMAHVVTVKRIVGALSRALGRGELPPGFGPQFEEAKAQDGVTGASFATLAEARAACRAAHEDLLAFIRELHQPVNTELRFSHFVFGAMNSREWTIFQRVHDIDHTPHIGEIKATPGFPSA